MITSLSIFHVINIPSLPPAYEQSIRFTFATSSINSYPLKLLAYASANTFYFSLKYLLHVYISSSSVGTYGGLNINTSIPIFSNAKPLNPSQLTQSQYNLFSSTILYVAIQAS